MRTYVTEITARHPKTGKIERWYGPEIQALTPGLAQKYCDTNGLSYCKVVGEKLGEYIENDLIHTHIQTDHTKQGSTFNDN